MRNKAYRASNYVFQAGERILVDTNIWLFLVPPVAQPPPHYAQAYSATLKRLLAAKALPVVEALVLSEYLNRYLRVEFGASWRSRYGNDFKAFRRSMDFPPVARAAVGDVRQILNLAALRDTPLHLVKLPEILKETEAGTLDYNDGVMVDTCRLRGWKLLTDDSDMTVGGIDVLTNNPRLLTACP